ncbi:MAG: fumarate hydratase [Gammaproteobacteria bacterium]
MTTIKQQDLIRSIADSLQFISCYHPKDFIDAVHQAYQMEQSKAAKDALAQILVNSRMCAEGKRPICQDTGIVVVYIKIGMQVQWEADMSINEMVNAGVRKAYTDADNILRASIMTDPAGERKNTGDNTPAVIHTEIVAGDRVEVYVAAKGGGSENKAKLAMLNPTDNIVDWVVETVPTLGAGWCPPGILGIGIGGTAEKAALLAKQSLFSAIDIQELQQRGAAYRLEELRLEIYDKVNALGIGAQGLGGLTTVLDVKILDYPTHAASLPVALIPNCAANRHAHFVLDGSGPALQTPPALSDWPEISWDGGADSRRVNLDGLSKADIATWKSGETLLLSGKLLSGRDAAHKRIKTLLDQGEPLPDGVDLRDRFIYYVGPVDPVRDEVVGPAGPTTATRMDKFTDTILEQTGLIGMIGKAERGPEAIEAIRKNGAVYLTAVGGAAYLVSRAITSAKVVAFPEMGMEAIREFEVKDMPVTVAVDAAGNSIHQSGPAEWKQIIMKKRATG